MAATMLLAGPAMADGNRLGVGTNYWMALNDIDSDVDGNGFSRLPNYQHNAGIFTLELAGELPPFR